MAEVMVAVQIKGCRMYRGIIRKRLVKNTLSLCKFLFREILCFPLGLIYVYILHLAFTTDYRPRFLVTTTKEYHGIFY